MIEVLQSKNDWNLHIGPCQTVCDEEILVELNIEAPFSRVDDLNLGSRFPVRMMIDQLDCQLSADGEMVRNVELLTNANVESALPDRCCSDQFQMPDKQQRVSIE